MTPIFGLRMDNLPLMLDVLVDEFENVVLPLRDGKVV
jgi:hypothetical protein